MPKKYFLLYEISFCSRYSPPQSERKGEQQKKEMERKRKEKKA
jgi:hypothetical protein